MTDQELRLECLRLAESSSSNDRRSTEIVSAAADFYEFVTSQRQKLEALEQMEKLVASLNHQSSDLLFGLEKQRIELKQTFPQIHRELETDKQSQ